MNFMNQLTTLETIWALAGAVLITMGAMWGLIVELMRDV